MHILPYPYRTGGIQPARTATPLKAQGDKGGRGWGGIGYCMNYAIRCMEGRGRGKGEEGKGRAVSFCTFAPIRNNDDTVHWTLSK